MKPSIISASVLALVAIGAPAAGAAPRARPSRAATSPLVQSLRVSPATVVLSGPGAIQQLVVTGVKAGGVEVDLTRSARYAGGTPHIATVEPGGHVRIGTRDGSAVIEVTAGGRKSRVTVGVRNALTSPPPSFRRDILPLLSRTGCGQGACHAKAGGQNGFQLSVLAYDPEADYHSLVRGASGRRVNRQDPGRSLFLMKATSTVPHAGGQRFRVGSPEYRVLADWVARGAPWGDPQEPVLARVEAEPKERRLTTRTEQQLIATAVYSDGSRRDVTTLAEFKSNETGIADVVEAGLLKTTNLSGETAVMVRYLGQVAVVRVTVPQLPAVPAPAYGGLPRFNFVDEPGYRKLAQLNLLPSELCDDLTFLRRASLDLIGTLPTPDETRAFQQECEAERSSAGATSPAVARKARERLVDRLLDRPEYADYWTIRWVNLLLVDRDPLFPKGAFAYDRWVREAFRQNVPFDQFARDLVSATGETYRNGAANFFRALATSAEQGKSLSQLFLGIRIDCAQCHHHPSERWSQDDFYSMAAFFARVRRKGSGEFEQIVYNGADGEVTHPKTGQMMPLKPLGGPVLAPTEGEDRREALARWMTAPENPFFARTAVNRVWGLLFGRGLVEPVDDFRLTNPATNEPLLDALAKDFVAHRYDLKHLFRTLVNSATYQRSSTATKNNARDTQNYARYYPRRLPAETLLDAIGQATGVPEVFQGHPASTRAIQMWDNKLPIEFLDVFGKPSRLSVCECDRPTDGSVTQVLHLMNAPAIQNRLTAADGRVAALDKSGKTPDAIVEELYLATYCRPPRPEELAAARGAFSRTGATRRAAIEDLLWVLLNSPEFVFGH